MKKRHTFQQIVLFLFPLSFLLIGISKCFPTMVTNLYTKHFNKWTIQMLSKLTGFIPFSLFEWLLYFIVISLITYFIILFIHLIQSPQKWRPILGGFTLNLLSTTSLLYFLFTILWGLNYYQLPLEDTFNLKVGTYSTEELITLYEKLIHKTNNARVKVLETDEGIFKTNETSQQIFKRAPLGYKQASLIYPLLKGDYGLPKGVSLSNVMSYTNITGIYSPFTAEANVNVSVPETTLLFTTMHEMAHQRGFANENEANFIAYLTCIFHPDIDFQYSGYLNALSYVNRALGKVNREKLIQLNEQLSEGVRRDLSYQSAYWKQFEGKVEETFTQMNETYLKLNGVSDGVQSYGRIVDLLLAYHSK